MKLIRSFAILLLLIGTVLSAQQRPDSKQADLAIIAHVIAMSPAEIKETTEMAEQGDAEAQYLMGVVYRDGRTLPRNLERAEHWMLKSAEQGHAGAQRSYGMMRVSKEALLGEQWMLRAAGQNDAEAQFWLAFGYENNWFGTTDKQEALKWYTKAAENGCPDAQVELGLKLKYGEDMEQNYETAAKWFRMAADHVPNLGGAFQGRNELGLLYMEGLGVPQDFLQAYFWFSIDSREGNIERAKTHLSVAQIHVADQWVTDWKKQHIVSPEIAAAFENLHSK